MPPRPNVGKKDRKKGPRSVQRTNQAALRNEGDGSVVQPRSVRLFHIRVESRLSAIGQVRRLIFRRPQAWRNVSCAVVGGLTSFGTAAVDSCHYPTWSAFSKTIEIWERRQSEPGRATVSCTVGRLFEARRRHQIPPQIAKLANMCRWRSVTRKATVPRMQSVHQTMASIRRTSYRAP